jgi:hypothetical protein
LLLASSLLFACGGESHGDDNAAGAAGSEAGAGGHGQSYACTGIDCVCQTDAGLTALCHGECVSYANDHDNCGACDNACGADMSCVAGQCTCGGSVLTACGNKCVDMHADASNCGACGKACASGESCVSGACTKQAGGSCASACDGGRVCTNGACVCPSGLMFCDGSCIDANVNAAHCGSCDHACEASQVCAAGSCACAAGKELCGNSCLDLQNDPANCGACGHACSGTQICGGGMCQVAWSDGCTATPAHGLNLTDVAIYQTIKVPVMDNGSAVPVSARAVDIIAGRFAHFRGFVTLAKNYVAHDVSMRVTIINGSTTDRYAFTQKVTSKSNDVDPNTSFQLTVPADKITTTTRYSVELVDCAAGSGDVMSTRFPAPSGEVELGARVTGGLKIRLIPVKANGRVPDLSSTTLAAYQTYMEAMYPIDHATLTVGKQITTTYPINWTTLVDQIRQQRKADNPAPDVYYYGLVQPTASLKDYCKGGCTAGIGYVNPATQAPTRAAVGLSYGDEISASTMAHEVGHNHGRNHAPCAPGNSISGVDDSYPYRGAQVGVWGFDVRKGTYLAPSVTFDIMGYCDPKWISDYSYAALVDRVAYINSPEGLMPSDTTPIAKYRVLLVDADGPRWSVPLDEPTAAFGEEEQADILDVYGQVITQVTVYRTEAADGSSSTILVPEPADSSWNAVRVMGADALAFSAPITVPGPMN